MANYWHHSPHENRHDLNLGTHLVLHFTSFSLCATRQHPWKSVRLRTDDVIIRNNKLFIHLPLIDTWETAKFTKKVRNSIIETIKTQKGRANRIVNHVALFFFPLRERWYLPVTTIKRRWKVVLEKKNHSSRETPLLYPLTVKWFFFFLNFPIHSGGSLYTLNIIIFLLLYF